MRNEGAIVRLMAKVAIGALFGPGLLCADYPVSTQTMNLRFSDSGDLISAELCYPACADAAQRIRIGGDEAFAVSTSLGPEAWVMTPGLEEADRLLQFSHPRGAVISWRIPEDGYLLELEISGAQEGIERLQLRAGEAFGERTAPGFGQWLESVRYVHLESEGWAGFRNRYWALTFKPDEALSHSLMTADGEPGVEISVELPESSGRLSLFLGPLEPNVLEQADPELKSLMYGGLWFWLRWICFGLLWLLTFIHGFVSSVLPAQLSWGLAIMLLSLAVHILMRPLSYLADNLQDSVHETESRLAPELAKIRREHRGEEQAERILALYKREGVHPLYSLKSLLGVAIVIPVFIGAFDMLAENIELAGTSFLWIKDLSLTDAVASLPFELPFFGSELNLLPFLMTALSVLASWLHRPPALDPSLRHKQLRNMAFLALAFFVLFYTFPSGMVLYWTTNNLISAVKGAWHHSRSAEPA